MAQVRKGAGGREILRQTLLNTFGEQGTTMSVVLVKFVLIRPTPPTPWLSVSVLTFLAQVRRVDGGCRPCFAQVTGGTPLGFRY